MRRNTFLSGILVALALLVAVPALPAAAMDTSYHTPVGPFQYITYTGTNLGIPTASVLVGSATKTGTLIVNPGFRNLNVSTTASHAFSATLTTYLDAAGTIANEAVTDTGTTDQAKVLRTTANYPFASFKVTITDTSAVTGTCAVKAAVGQN